MTNQQGAPEALYASAMEFAAEKASISYVQRKCRCSWNEAEQMLERMVREGIIETYGGRKSAALVEAQQPAAHVQNHAEIEHVAGDVSKNGPESNMAQQPAPSAAAIRALDAYNSDTRDADPGSPLERLRFFCSLAMNGQDWRDAEQFFNELAAQPSPTPQADSAPATSDLITIRKPTTRAEVEWLVKLAHLLVGDVNEQLQRVLDGADVPQADSQPAPGLDIAVMQLAESVGLIGPASRVGDLHAAIQRFHDLICVNATIKAAVMAADAIRGAARAQADSVTAPADGETYHLGACIVDGVLFATVMRKEPGRSGAVTVLLSEQIPVERLQDRDVIVDAAPQADSAPRPRQLLAQADPVSGSLVGYFSDEKPPFATHPTPQADSAQDEPLQAFDSPRAKALMRAWEEGWAACRDAEYVGEEAQNDAFNSSHTLTLCIAEDQQLPAPQADSQPAPVRDALDAAFEAVRKRLCAMQRYSFVLDDDGLIRRVQDRTGNWIEFDDAHELFDPVAIDAARKQGGA